MSIWIKAMIKGVSAVLEILALMAVLLVIVVMFLQSLMPLSPVITILFVAIFTKVACRRRETAVMSLGGIFLYVMSWSVTDIYGQIPGSLVFLLSVCSWIQAVPMSFNVRSVAITQPAT